MPHIEDYSNPFQSTSYSLNVIVVGAGIAGLTATVALRQAGHSVQVFEKSKFAAETGAALLVSPNGAKVLKSLQFDFDRARGCEAKVWETVHGSNLERFSSMDFCNAEKKYGERLRSVHRVDLHQELLRLALDPGDNKARIYLSSPVIGVGAEEGEVELEDGRRFSADLVVAADGVHSAARDTVAGRQDHDQATGMSAFRFLLPTTALQKESTTASLLNNKAEGCTIIADTADLVQERHMVWYGCRGGEVQNFVGIHPTRRDPEESARGAMLDEFQHFHPGIRRVIELAEDVKCWPLFSRQPLRSLARGRVVLIGDAAHPMLPFGGQGSNQAIEDAGALGQILQDMKDLGELPKRLNLYEEIRLKRTSMVQIMSRVRVGREQEVCEELKSYANAGEHVPSTFAERIEHHFGYDPLEACRAVKAQEIGAAT